MIIDVMLIKKDMYTETGIALPYMGMLYILASLFVYFFIFQVVHRLTFGSRRDVTTNV